MNKNTTLISNYICKVYSRILTAKNYKLYFVCSVLFFHFILFLPAPYVTLSLFLLCFAAPVLFTYAVVKEVRIIDFNAFFIIVAVISIGSSFLEMNSDDNVFLITVNALLVNYLFRLELKLLAIRDKFNNENLDSKSVSSR